MGGIEAGVVSCSMTPAAVHGLDHRSRPWRQHIAAYLPTNAGLLITHAHQESADLLTPWQGFAVLCLWSALLLGAAAWSLSRRDA